MIALSEGFHILNSNNVKSFYIKDTVKAKAWCFVQDNDKSYELYNLFLCDIFLFYFLSLLFFIKKIMHGFFEKKRCGTMLGTMRKFLHRKKLSDRFMMPRHPCFKPWRSFIAAKWMWWLFASLMPTWIRSWLKLDWWERRECNIL